MGKPPQERSSRRVVEAENVAKLDIGISVMAIVVLGQHHGQGTERPAEPRGRPPAELGRVAPPDVQLSQPQAGQRARPTDVPEKRRDAQIRQRSQKTIEQHRGAARYDRVIEIRTPPVVMRSQMQSEPKMLRDVIEERRGKVAGDERNDESGDKEHACGNLAWKLHDPYHIPHERAF